MLAVAGDAAADSYYANANRDLFHLPAAAGVAYADLCFRRDGAPNSNPATLGFDTSSDVSLSYSGFYRNVVSVSTVSSVTSTGSRSALGVSLNYLLVPEILITSHWTPDKDGGLAVPSQPRYETASEVFFHAAYGHRFDVKRLVRIGVGVGINGLRRRLTSELGYGIGLDAGVLAEIPKAGVRVGLFSQNLTTSYVYWHSDYRDIAYPHLRAGLSWHRDIPYVYGHIRILYTSADLLANEGANAVGSASGALEGDTTAVPKYLEAGDPLLLAHGSAGIEYCVLNRVMLRAGLRDIARSHARNLTFGAGILVLRRKLGFDFAYLPHDLAGSYTVSMTYRW